MITTMADIASGNTSAADIFFLVAVILAVLGVVVSLVLQPRALVSAILCAAVASASLAFLLL
jgi:hypothetical protein